jgi:hypothetical protein
LAGLPETIALGQEPAQLGRDCRVVVDNRHCGPGPKRSLQPRDRLLFGC